MNQNATAANVSAARGGVGRGRAVGKTGGSPEGHPPAIGFHAPNEWAV